MREEPSQGWRSFLSLLLSLGLAAPLYERDRDAISKVFKTGRAEQPSAWKVRFLRRSADRSYPAKTVASCHTGELAGLKTLDAFDRIANGDAA